ncbi:MAG: hypothetical protein GX133_06520 [Syntrophomonadaceae bacterium]|nr:hypothetical protein [Syntrophomonadaceae bacterium]
MRFLAGVVLGIFIGTGGTMAITGNDFRNAGKIAAEAVTKTVQIVAKYVDKETLEAIQGEVNRELVPSLTGRDKPDD